MSANNKPLFPLTPKIAVGQTIATANTAKDGTGTVVTVATGGSNGQRVDSLRCVPIGSNVATVLRLFINNGSTNATAGNNALYKEYSLPATTLSETAQMSSDIEIPLDLFLPSGYKINATIGTTVAAGWSLVALAGDY